MNSQDIYNYLPLCAKKAALHIYGSRLRISRYGGDHSELCIDAASRERYNVEQWEKWVAERLRRQLRETAESVSWYKRYFASIGEQCSKDAFLDISKWPVIGKREVRDSPASFINIKYSQKRLYVETTSGTTGSPLTVRWSQGAAISYYALFEQRIRRWNEVNLNTPYAILGGRIIVAISRQKPPFGIWNAPMQQLYLSSYHLSQTAVTWYVEEIFNRRCEYIYGYASSLYSLACFMKQQCIKPLRLKAAVSNAEPLYQWQRDIIKEMISENVRNTYGMSELVCAASESAASDGLMELWPEVGYVEILDPDPQTGIGRIVATGLINDAMPLIRYDTGDRGKLVQGPGRLQYVKFETIEGRSDDVIILKDGRRIGRMDPVFKRNLPINEAQIIQHDYDDIEVKVVPRYAFTDADVGVLISAVRERVGDVHVRITIVDAIERTKAGKFRAVISHVDA